MTKNLNIERLTATAVLANTERRKLHTLRRRLTLIAWVFTIAFGALVAAIMIGV